VVVCTREVCRAAHPAKVGNTQRACAVHALLTWSRGHTSILNLSGLDAAHAAFVAGLSELHPPAVDRNCRAAWYVLLLLLSQRALLSAYPLQPAGANM